METPGHHHAQKAFKAKLWSLQTSRQAGGMEAVKREAGPGGRSGGNE